jgi:glycerophosphoryl diester phosphodiesterase
MRARCLTTLCLITAMAPWAVGASFDFYQPLMPPRDFQVIARGAALDRAPANTKAALQQCIADQFEWVGVAVARTKDGHHVLADESRALKSAAGAKTVADITLAELKQLDAGSWFAKRFSGARWLTLAECLELAKGKINVRLHLLDADPQELVRQVRAAGMERQVLVMADRELLLRLREASAGSLATLLSLPHTAAHKEDSLLPSAVAIDADLLTTDACVRHHERGVKVVAQFAGEQDRGEFWQKAIAAGVDYLETNRPEELVADTLARRLPARTCRLACHRGASRYAPENTLAAFRKAARLHADLVEFDVRPSRDGVFFLLHDAKLDRTTEGRGPIRDLPSGDVAALDAGRWFASDQIGTRVPTLEEFLSWVPPGLELYFDAKDIPPEDLAKSLADHDLVERTVVYQGADYLRKLAQVDARIRAMPPARAAADVDKLLATPPFKPYAVDTPWRSLSRQYIEHCHAAGVRVFSDAPGGTDASAMRQAIGWGLDLIQTDEPLCYWRAVELASGKGAEPDDRPRTSAGD